jgi:hypothetical protein
MGASIAMFKITIGYGFGLSEHPLDFTMQNDWNNGELDMK